MAKDTDFYLSNQNVVAADFLFFNQTQFPQLFKMVKSDAGAAKMEGTLNFADADGAASF